MFLHVCCEITLVENSQVSFRAGLLGGAGGVWSPPGATTLSELHAELMFETMCLSIREEWQVYSTVLVKVILVESSAVTWRSVQESGLMWVTDLRADLECSLSSQTTHSSQSDVGQPCGSAIMAPVVSYVRTAAAAADEGCECLRGRPWSEVAFTLRLRLFSPHVRHVVCTSGTHRNFP